MAKSKKLEDLEQKIGELTLDLQRTRADFENYRKRVDDEKSMARASGRVSAIAQLLPIIDTVDRAIAHIPKELADNAWARGIAGLSKSLEKTMQDLRITKINAQTGTVFNPELHNAVQFDEEAEGEREVVSTELQPGYMLAEDVLRPAMVKVTKSH